MPLESSQQKAKRQKVVSSMEQQKNRIKDVLAQVKSREQEGKLEEAREILRDACIRFPNYESVWLYAARLQTETPIKNLYKRAVLGNPRSEKLWLKWAKSSEDEIPILKEAVNRLPGSVNLWTDLIIEIQDENEKKQLLHKAVKGCPTHLLFWLLLVDLESPEMGRQLMAQARQHNTGSEDVWIASARFEEFIGRAHEVPMFIQMAGSCAIKNNSPEVRRTKWMEEASKSGAANTIVTCREMIKYAMELDKDIGKDEWAYEAGRWIRQGRREVARCIYSLLLEKHPKDENLWMKAIVLEVDYGTKENSELMLEKAIEVLPQSELMWLTKAGYERDKGLMDNARATLEKALSMFPSSSDLFIDAYKLELEDMQFKKAASLLEKAREAVPTTDSHALCIWNKSARLARMMGDITMEKSLLEEGLLLYPNNHKSWLMLIELYERLGEVDDAKNACKEAVLNCPDVAALWMARAKLEESVEGPDKAMYTLISVTKKMPKDDTLWQAAIRTTIRAGYQKRAEGLMSQAFDYCPHSGILWYTYILELNTADHDWRKLITQAMEFAGNSPYIFLACGKLFLRENNMDKARQYFQRAVRYGQDIGDFWAYYFKFELQYGTKEQQQSVVDGCTKAKPKHGEAWRRVCKSEENLHQPLEVVLNKAAQIIT